MTLWVWLLGIGTFGWAIFQLWRAWKLGKILGGYIDYKRNTQPYLFWLNVSVNAAIATLLGVALPLIALHPISN